MTGEYTTKPFAVIGVLVPKILIGGEAWQVSAEAMQPDDNSEYLFISNLQEVDNRVMWYLSMKRGRQMHPNAKLSQNSYAVLE